MQREQWVTKYVSVGQALRSWKRQNKSKAERQGKQAAKRRSKRQTTQRGKRMTGRQPTAKEARNDGQNEFPRAWAIRRDMLPHMLKRSGNKLPFSIYWLNRAQTPYIANLPHPEELEHFVVTMKDHPAWCGLWVLHDAVSLACGYTVDAIREAEKQYGCCIVWAPEFENCHSTWQGIDSRFEAEGVAWDCAECYYQSFKLKPNKRSQQELERLAKMEGVQAWKWGRGLRRKEWWGERLWQNKREEAMRKVVEAKFKNPNLRALLNSTGQAPLVSIKNDSTWGFPGANRLGEILMRLRE